MAMSKAGSNRAPRTGVLLGSVTVALGVLAAILAASPSERVSIAGWVSMAQWLMTDSFRLETCSAIDASRPFTLKRVEVRHIGAGEVIDSKLYESIDAPTMLRPAGAEEMARAWVERYGDEQIEVTQSRDATRADLERADAPNAERLDGLPPCRRLPNTLIMNSEFCKAPTMAIITSKSTALVHMTSGRALPPIQDPI